jgi:hypothetical protein
MKATGDSPTSPAERKSTLIEFPGISRNSLPEWRKELSERVREVQERRARETAREAAEAERQRVEAADDAPQLELLPPTETPAMNPLVAAALKRIERAHQSASVETRQPRSSLATAVAYAPEREENIMNETVPPTIQLELETEPPAADPPPPAIEKSHLVIVPPPIEPAVVKADPSSSTRCFRRYRSDLLRGVDVADRGRVLSQWQCFPGHARVDSFGGCVGGRNLSLSHISDGVDWPNFGYAHVVVARNRYEDGIDSHWRAVDWPFVLLSAFIAHGSRYSLRTRQPRGLHCARSIHANSSSCNLKCIRNSFSKS